MTISVLYIHHSGVFGGASRSLLELVRAFPEGAVKAHVVTQRGKVPEVYRHHGIEVVEAVGLSQLDHTRFGYYRGMRWLLLARELAYVPFTILSMLQARRRWPRIDLVHVNEVTNLLSILLARMIFRVPLVVHVRSVQQCSRGGWRRGAVLALLTRANAVIAIDSTVRRSLPKELPVEIIHNGFIVGQSCPNEKPTEVGMFERQPMRVLFVGGLIVMKGILEFVQAAKLCADQGMNIRFIVVGEAPRAEQGIKAALLNRLGFSFDVQGYCRDFIKEHGLQEILEFRGFTLEIEQVYREADVLCFPSHLNAVGRPVIEAALSGVPSIVAISDTAEDTIRDRETGLCIPEKDAQALFEAVGHLYRHPEEIGRMGQAALELARQNFDIQRNAERVMGIYSRCLERTGSR